MSLTLTLPSLAPAGTSASAVVELELVTSATTLFLCPAKVILLTRPRLEPVTCTTPPTVAWRRPTQSLMQITSRIEGALGATAPPPEPVAAAATPARPVRATSRTAVIADAAGLRRAPSLGAKRCLSFYGLRS